MFEQILEHIFYFSLGRRLLDYLCRLVVLIMENFFNQIKGLYADAGRALIGEF